MRGLARARKKRVDAHGEHDAHKSEQRAKHTLP